MTKIKIPLSRSKILRVGIGLPISALVYYISYLIFYLYFGRDFLIKWISFLVLPVDVLLFIGTLLTIPTFFVIGLNITQLFDKKFGVIINSEGIYNNSSRKRIGFVPWSSINKIVTKKHVYRKYIAICTKFVDEDEIEGKGLVSTKLPEERKSFVTLTIFSDTLKIKFEDLEKLVRDGWEQSKSLQGEDLPTTLPNITPVTSII